MLFRHGDRGPLKFYPNDPRIKEVWPDGLAKLTRKGKKQHYAIGKFLRSMYEAHLSSDPNEVLVNSSSLDRCLRGAEVTTAAIYEPTGIWKFEDDLNWQPIPINYVSEDKDKFLSYSAMCPQAFKELSRLHSSVKTEISQKHQRMFEDVSNYIDFDTSALTNVLFIDDALMSMKTYNLTIPIVFNKYFDEIHELSEEVSNLFFGSDLILRLRIGPLLQELSENMQKKIRGDTPELKIQLFSAQDVHLNAIFVALNFSDMPQAPFCATLLVELHELANATFAVRLLYLNSTDPLNLGEPHVLILDDCSEFCPLVNFTKKFQHLIPDDWEQECQLSTSVHKGWDTTVIMYVMLAIAALLCILSWFCTYLYFKRKVNQISEKLMSNSAVSIANDLYSYSVR